MRDKDYWKCPQYEFSSTNSIIKTCRKDALLISPVAANGIFSNMPIFYLLSIPSSLIPEDAANDTPVPEPSEILLQSP